MMIAQRAAYHNKGEGNMSFGSNLQYLRRLRREMTQEALAEKLNVSRQTISRWEMNTAQPEMDKAIELCRIFNCTLDNLFREEMQARDAAYSDLRVEESGDSVMPPIRSSAPIRRRTPSAGCGEPQRRTA